MSTTSATRFLFVATDRISAFDVVLSPGIPDKGKILTQMSTFWFRHFGDIENHLLETEWDAFPVRGARASRSARTKRDREEVPRRPGRMRRARLPRRLGTQGVQRDRPRLRNRAGERADHRQQTARADLHAGDERRDRPRREHLVRADVHDRRRRPRRRSCAT